MAKNKEDLSRQDKLTWPKLASRLMRVAMVRADVTYHELAAEFARIGEADSSRAIEARVFRGKAPFSFFVKLLVLTRSDVPLNWRNALNSGLSWEARSAGVLQAELSRFGCLTFDELARRLDSFDPHLTAEQIEIAVKTGEFSIADFLQISSALGSTTIERYLDLPDLYATASASASSFSE